MTPVSLVGVVGAGFMGSGIAESVAVAGLRVIVYEPEEAALTRSREAIAVSTEAALRASKLTKDEAAGVRERVTHTSRLADLVAVDAVIEAVIEDARVKRALFEQLDAALPDVLFLASNTSSIPIAELASATGRPERVLGLHFFAPVPRMKLVELVVALESGAPAVSAAEAFAHAIGKHTIRTNDRSGFVVNILLVPYLLAAIRLYEQGFASREDIDDGMTLGCGHPMGPLALCDFIGLDVLYAVAEALYEEFKQPEYSAPPLLKRMVISGHHGRKTGRGLYQYGNGDLLDRTAT